MVKYQFEIEDSEWERWKETIPRSKALDQRIRELIKADADGRVVEKSPEPPEPTTEPDPPEVESGGSVSLAPGDVDQLRDELAGSGDLLERRVDALRAMYEHLVTHGEAEKGDLLGAVDVEATGYASADSVWSNMVKGKDTLRALPGVETPRDGMTTWRYADE